MLRFPIRPRVFARDASRPFSCAAWRASARGAALHSRRRQRELAVPAPGLLREHRRQLPQRSAAPATIRSRASLDSSVVERRRIGDRRDRLLVLQLAPRARQRQALDEQQVLDPQHPLDVRPAIDARAALRLRDAEIRELRLPRAQHVRLHLRDLADLRLPEQRPIGNLDRGPRRA